MAEKKADVELVRAALQLCLVFCDRLLCLGSFIRDLSHRGRTCNCFFVPFWSWNSLSSTKVVSTWICASKLSRGTPRKDDLYQEIGDPGETGKYPLSSVQVSFLLQNVGPWKCYSSFYAQVTFQMQRSRWYCRELAANASPCDLAKRFVHRYSSENKFLTSVAKKKWGICEKKLVETLVEESSTQTNVRTHAHIFCSTVFLFFS